jgi:hypothetical protein
VVGDFLGAVVGHIADRDSGLRGRFAYGNPVRDPNDKPMDIADLARAKRDWAGKDNMLTSVFRPGEINEKGEPIIYFWEDGKRVALRLADGKGQGGEEREGGLVHGGREEGEARCAPAHSGGGRGRGEGGEGRLRARS